jgi:hypothetical protein
MWIVKKLMCLKNIFLGAVIQLIFGGCTIFKKSMSLQNLMTYLGKKIKDPDLKEIKEKPGEHDIRLSQDYDAIENLLNENAAQKKLEDRKTIGFKQ